MEDFGKKWAVLFIGPPGSGKDTQAEMVAGELGLAQIKTSQIIEHKFVDAKTGDAVITEQKRKYDAGELVDSKIIEGWVIEAVRGHAASDMGVVMSGSPRTPEEAAVELPVLEELYGRDLVKIINVHISEAESLKRNSHRRICELNGHSIPNSIEFEGITVCPKDGSPIITRAMDDPDTIVKRYQVYLAQTQPVIDFLNEKGYNIITINGEQSIEDVHRDILDKLW